MKRKITLLLFAVAATFSVKSQVILSEDFTEPFTPGATNPTTPGYDWVVINNSSPSATGSWAQGNQTGGNGQTTAYNGATDDFFMADFTAVGAPVGDISAFLITPTLTLYNGAEIKFATRTLQFSGAALYPDRMQVLLSPTNNNTIPTGTASVGTFTQILLDMNPNLTQSTNGTVVNGTMTAGYPQQWTVYTLPISGITGTLTGARIAFRYFVPNGGSGGGNSRLVALDAVRVTLPCGPTVQSFTTCAGMTTTLTAQNGVAVTTYSWDTGSTVNTTTVNPSATQVYSLYPSIGGSVSCGVVQTATVTVSSNLSVLIAANQTMVCAGTPVVITTTSSAMGYTWTTGATGPSITVTPSVSTLYTVTVGSINSSSTALCLGTASVNITVNPNPTISATTSNTLVCTTGATATTNFTATGTATLFGWFNGATGAVLGSGQTFAVPVPTINSPTGFTVGVIGFDANGCSDSDGIPIQLALKPTITTTVNKTPACINTTVELSAGGADTYTWSGPVSGVNDAISYPTGTVTGNKTFTVLGINSDGCTASKAVVVNVNACTGIEKVEGDASASYIFPNPFANQLTVSGLSGRVVIYNSLGQIVVDIKTSEADEVINTSELPRGAYILTSYDTNGVNTKTIKLVKN